VMLSLAVVPSELETLLQVPDVLRFCKYRSKSTPEGPESCPLSVVAALIVKPLELGWYEFTPVPESVPV
jgi:hypothetical protein